MNEIGTEKPTKVFISHSSEDSAFVKPLVELFEHIGLNSENMFCSSAPGYGVPLHGNIYNYLKKQFQNYDLRVIFVLSENYYKSVDSLNEMGAAWVLQHRYTSVLLPQFDFRDTKGVIKDMEISIKLDSEKFELRGRLNELRNSLQSQTIWERHRDEFIEKVNSIEIYWRQLRQLRERNKPLEDWVLPLQKLIEVNPSSYDAMYMLGTIYAETNDLENAIKYLTRTMNLSQSSELKEKAGKQLEKLGYTI